MSFFSFGLGIEGGSGEIEDILQEIADMRVVVDSIKVDTTQTLSDVSVVNGTTSSIETALAQVQSDLNSVGLKVDQTFNAFVGTYKINPAEHTLTIYNTDGTTPMVVYDLKDTEDNPSYQKAFQRIKR
jgi:hypothetical protein